MKILRIKLRNLNSLRGEHVVDFTRAPLAGCGIFAITGPTGAGKSTLLDAMTLALYGKAARYDNDRNPENMMSRHTADCLAEVTFAVDEQTYRAEWQLRRARGRTDGKIQPPLRFLYDAADKPLNRLATECDAEIERLTGLDYSRFLRSVLLAQGEFSRFLKANPEERAALLESLTGTEIYTELGKLAHEETARREKELDAVRIALEQYQLLSEEEIAARVQSIQQDRAALESWQTRRKEQQTRWQLAEQRLKCEDELRGLAAQKSLLENESAEHSAQRERLRLHQLAQPFASSLQRHDLANATLSQCQNALDQATRDAAATEQQHARLLHQAMAYASQRIDMVATAKQVLDNSLSQLATQTQAIHDWLAANAHWQGLDAELSRFSEQAHQLRNLHSLHAETQRQIETRQADLEKSGHSLQQAQEWQGTCHATLDRKQQTLNDAQQSLRSLCGDAEKAPEPLRDEWQQRQQQIQRWHESLVQENRLVESIAALENTILQSREAHAAAAEQQLVCQQSLEACARQLRLRIAHLHLAERQSSLEEHRAQLHDGEPCPLCGATEHPLAHSATPSLTLAELRITAEHAQRDMEQAQQRHMQAQTTSIEAKAAADSLQTQLATRQQEFASLVAQRRAAGYEDATVLSLQTQQQELEQLLKNLNAAIETKRTAELAHREAESQWQMARQRCQSLQEAIDEKQQQQTQRRESQQQRSQQIATLHQQLLDAIAPFQLTMPDFSADPFSLADWEKAASHHPRAEQKLVTLQHEREKLLHQSQQLEAEMSELLGQRTSWSEEVRQYPQANDQTAVVTWASLRDAGTAHQQSQRQLQQAIATAQLLRSQLEEAKQKQASAEQQLLDELQDSPFVDIIRLRAALLTAEEEQRINVWQNDWQQRNQTCEITIVQRNNDLQVLIAAGAPSAEQSDGLRESLQHSEQQIAELQSRITLTEDSLRRDEQQRAEHAQKSAAVAVQWRELESWQLLRHLIGSHDGAKFRKFAQGISLDILTHHANRHLRQLSERYRLQRQSQSELTLEVVDLYQANTSRPMASLSGGETFIVSLALALGLSDLAGRNVQIDSLFIDEGFGTLDADTLDTALSTLESLYQRNKTIGIISHIDLLKERIRTKIVVRKLSAGSSTIEVV